MARKDLELQHMPAIERMHVATIRNEEGQRAVVLEVFSGAIALRGIFTEPTQLRDMWLQIGKHLADVFPDE